MLIRVNRVTKSLIATKVKADAAKFIALSAIVCTAVLVGCATTHTNTQNRESMLVASGFKVITPKTAAHKQKLPNLPPGKVTMIQKGKKTYYIFPDPAHTKHTWGDPRSTRLTNSSALKISLAGPGCFFLSHLGP